MMEPKKLGVELEEVGEMPMPRRFTLNPFRMANGAIFIYRDDKDVVSIHDRSWSSWEAPRKRANGKPVLGGSLSQE